MAEVQQAPAAAAAAPGPIVIDTQHDDMVHDSQLDYYGTKLATASSGTFFSCVKANVFIVFVCVLGSGAVWSDTRYLERLLAKLKSVSPAYLFGLVPGTFAVGTSIGIASVVCSHRRSCQRNETSAVTASGIDSSPWMMCHR